MKCKRTWNIRKDGKGVSPVIATILMVAITVVLAAVLYVMVGGFIDDPNRGTLLAGSLSNDDSTPSNGNATLKLSITTPSEPKLANMEVKIYDLGDNRITTFDVEPYWVHVGSNEGDDYVATGDKLKFSIYGTDIGGYKVVITVDDYTGTIELEL